MDKKRAYLVLAILLSIIVLQDNYSFNPTGMVTAEMKSLDYALNDLDNLQATYNRNLDRVPSFAKTIFGNENIKLVITREDGSILTLSLVTEKAVLKTITKQELEEYTLEVRTTEQTIEAIKNSPNQIERLKQAIKDKEIAYKALRFRTRVKTGLSRVFLLFY